jgi:hypothetical protein
MGLLGNIPGLDKYRTEVKPIYFDTYKAKRMTDQIFIWIGGSACFLPWLKDQRPDQFELITKSMDAIDVAALRGDLQAVERECNRTMNALQYGLRMYFQGVEESDVDEVQNDFQFA